MSNKTIRVWDGCKVVGVFGVDQNGSSFSIGAVGGAGNSTRADIEIDPWSGLIVDRSKSELGPVDFHHEPQPDEDFED